jgi:hypothetical protein
MPSSNRSVRRQALTAISFTPVQAQAVIQEPAYCAQFDPGANCQNKGPGNPYTDPNYRRYGGPSSGQGRAVKLLASRQSGTRERGQPRRRTTGSSCSTGQ